MKPLFLITFLTWFCFSCKDDSQFHSPSSENINSSDWLNEKGVLTGNYNINGKWRPKEIFSGNYKSNDSSFYALGATPYDDHIFGMNFIPLEFVGFTKVGKGAEIGMDYIIYVDGGFSDVAEDYYTADSSKSWLNVLSYDPVKRIVEAEAEGDLYVQLPKMNPNNPDTVRIRHAHWRVKLKKP